MKNPEKFLNRVVNYKNLEEGAAGSPTKKTVIDKELITEFQKAIAEFNDNIVTHKKSEDLYEMPATEMDEKKYKFTRPEHFNHENLIDILVVSFLIPASSY